MGVATRTGTEAGSIAPDEPAARRTTMRRRALPSGRAVAGGFLVAAAALGVYVAARGTRTSDNDRYVVAARTISPGTALTAADLEYAPLALAGGVRDRAFTDVDAIVGRVVVAPLATGELVQAGSVLGRDAADGRLQLSIPVERARAVDGLLQPGERVDVVGTFGTGESGKTLVVARDAEVRRVDNGSRNTIGGSDNSILLLAVEDADEALAVIHASQVGKVTVVRSTGVPGEPSSSEYQPPGDGG